jgi:hypothetical protein
MQNNNNKGLVNEYDCILPFFPHSQSNALDEKKLTSSYAYYKRCYEDEPGDNRDLKEPVLDICRHPEKEDVSNVYFFLFSKKTTIFFGRKRSRPKKKEDKAPKDEPPVLE